MERNRIFSTLTAIDMQGATLRLELAQILSAFVLDPSVWITSLTSWVTGRDGMSHDHRLHELDLTRPDYFNTLTEEFTIPRPVGIAN
jgi:hypothetical protein